MNEPQRRVKNEADEFEEEIKFIVKEHFEKEESCLEDEGIKKLDKMTKEFIKKLQEFELGTDLGFMEDVEEDNN
jgi:hemerythrin